MTNELILNLLEYNNIDKTMDSSSTKMNLLIITNMTIDKIGRNARLIWEILNNKKALHTFHILNISELNYIDFSMSLCWLVRGYKIAYSSF